MIHRYYIFAFLLCLCSFSVMGQTKSAFLEEADEAFEVENYAAAFTYYSNALEFDEDDIDVMYMVAQSARHYDSYFIADSMYKRVIESEDDGQFPEASFWRGIVLQRLGKYQKSNELFNLYLSEHSGEDEFLTKRANKEISANEWALDMLKYRTEDPKIKHLSTNVNTPYSDFGAYLLNDTLFYSSLRFENEEDDHIPTRPVSKILISVDTAEGEVIEEISKEELHTAHTAFSINRDRLYYTICEYVTGNRIRCDLYYRTIDSAGIFGEAVKLPGAINNDTTTSTEPTIGRHPESGNEAIYYVSDRKDGKGKRDIWIAEVKEDGQFSTPENLQGVNTNLDDLTPHYDLNTNTLYFSSEGYLGFGGLDVYSTRYNQDNGEWSSPENMDYPINSSYHDIYFFMLNDGERGYVSSNRPGSFFLDEAQEACCFDIYLAEVPDLPADLLTQVFLATTMDTVYGSEVKLYEKEIPQYADIMQHQDSTYYRFNLKRNKDYVVVASKEGYLPDTIQLSTRQFKDTADIVKKLYLKTIDLDLRALVFDGRDSLPLLGAEVTVINLSDEDDVREIVNLDNNEFIFPLDRDKKYRVIASRKGFKSQSIVIDPSDHDDANIVEKKLYLPIGDLADFLPLVLYFDNDYPDPNTWNRSTDKIYTETYFPYYDRKPVYKEVFTEPLTEEKEINMATTRLERFFETEVKKGKYDLDNFLGVLLKELEEGVPVNIFLKGYTSPRYTSSYNYALGLRRVASVKNELSKYKDGALIPYMRSGQLVIKQKSFGEIESPKDVVADLDNERMSIYSVDASKERRVEIINVDKD